MKHNSYLDEVKSKNRFAFGKNWQNFLRSLSKKKILAAENSLKEMLQLDSLSGMTFLDVGSGSGLFSLAAYNLGAKVVSFDFDANSVWCTNQLRERFCSDKSRWTVKIGSILESDFIKSLGHFDIVYSWGVLHHTGNLWKALENSSKCVKNEGLLFIALYNYQYFWSSYWRVIKRLYIKSKLLRPLIVTLHIDYFFIPRMIKKLYPKINLNEV